VLMDTFLVRTLLVPATAVLIGRWNWWPSALRRTRPAGAADAAEGGPATPLRDLALLLKLASRGAR